MTDWSNPKEVTIWLTRAVAYVAYAFLVISEIILVQGFLLKLFGANPTSSYVQWAYRSLDRVMAPFRGIFKPVELEGNAVLDTSIIFAMVIYGIVAILVSTLLHWLTDKLHRMERDRMLDDAEARARADAYSAGYTAGATVPPVAQAPAPATSPGHAAAAPEAPAPAPPSQPAHGAPAADPQPPTSA